MPPTAPKRLPYAVSLIALPYRIKYPKTPPIGSLRPLTNDHQNPFHLDPVA